jgi:hypothetical protein
MVHFIITIGITGEGIFLYAKAPSVLQVALALYNLLQLIFI